MIRAAIRTSAARSLRVVLAVAVLGLGAGVSVAAARGVFAHDAETVAAKQDCREVVVETDEGYGVRGAVTRMVCRAEM